MVDLPPPVPAIEFNLSSTGISKGLAQTDGPQVLVRGELAFGKLYLGAYVKNVDSSSYDGEAAAQVGVRSGTAGFEIAASASWKRAVNPVAGADRNALELGSSVSRKMGRITPRVSLVWSPDDLGSTGRTLFAEAGATTRIAKALSASAAIGRRERTGGADYTAWNAGLSWTPAKPVSADLRYYDSDCGDSQACRARLVLSGKVKL